MPTEPTYPFRRNLAPSDCQVPFPVFPLALDPLRYDTRVTAAHPNAAHGQCVCRRRPSCQRVDATLPLGRRWRLVRWHGTCNGSREKGVPFGNGGVSDRCCLAFCSAGYFERAPYRNHADHQPPTNVTRFIGLAAVANAEKQKWIYAFNIKPRSACEPAELLQLPPGTTRSPLVARGAAGGGTKRAGDGQSFFFGNQRRPKRQRDGNGRSRKPREPSGPCWFCLGSPEVERHLVVSVGKKGKAYLAMPKGLLTDGHILILPVQHAASSIGLDEASVSLLSPNSVLHIL